MRADQLTREPLCRSCRLMGLVREATEVDHITPLFRGGTDDPANLQSLCAVCHGDKTLRDLGRRGRTAIGSDGIPLDPAHHWNMP